MLETSISSAAPHKHSGQERTNTWSHGATQVPIVQSVAFGYDKLDEWLDVALGQKPGHIYSRNTNPTLHAFEEKVRILERGEAATSFASGMAAVANTLFTFLQPGDRVVSVKDTYGGTNKIFIEFLPKMGVEVVLLDTTDFAAIELEIARGCKLLYLETPTNPTLKVIDIERLARAGHAVGAIVVTDNTFATPINQNPLELGSDIVLHSASKFLGGHADALGGVICGSKELVQQVYHYREITGAALDPFAAYLLLRGMKTLDLRIERQNASALKIAHWLEAHPAIERVYYPGLESHPQHECCQAANAWFWRHDELCHERRLRNGESCAATFEIGAPCRKSGQRRNHCWTTSHDQPCRM